LARMGATVLVTARDPGRGRDTAEEIRRDTGREVAVLPADLASQASVRELAAEVRRRTDRLHVLLNNAGAIYTTRQLSPDGHELTLALNHLGYFLLTNLLLDLLRSGAPSRVVNVASAAHRRGRIDWDDLQGERRYGGGWKAYSQSKLANILFTRELARRLQGSGVTANCLHPGVVATGFGHNNPTLFGTLVKLAAPLFISPARGADTAVWLATAPEVAGVSGEYFARRRPIPSTRAGQDPEAARRLWEVSERLTGLA
ncbi:MAG TPA: SDR family oxidoreductase, partial [Gemmatimonadales bacterium]|nr:SDR family oxidoreductase [Gemmatimonadales bacterium]